MILSRLFAGLLLSLTIVVPIHAENQSCNDILQKNGAFNSIIQVSSHSADEQVYEWLKTATWNEFKQKQDAGLRITLPIEGIPVSADGKYTQEQYQKFVEKRQQGKLRFFTENEFYQTIQNTASPVIAKAWSNCMHDTMKRDRGLTCSIENNDEQENGTVVYKARYFTDDLKSGQPIVAKGGFTVVGASVIGVNPLADGSPVPVGGALVTLRRDGKKGITITLNTSNKGACDSVQISGITAPQPLPIKIERFPAISTSASHPQVVATLPAGYKLIGGGALANWSGHGSLLIASYPMGNSWFAQSKDHIIGDPTTITAWAIGLYDPQDQWDVKVVQSLPVQYNPSDRSSATATLPPGYALTGGGAVSAPENPGILLTGSYPLNQSTWQANAQDHTVYARGTLTAYVIGIKPRIGLTPLTKIWSATSGVLAHPSFNTSVDPGWVLTSGGAYTQCPSRGNLLTASYPFGPSTWRAEAKDHDQSCESTITVSAIGLEAGPGSYFGSANDVSFSTPNYSAIADPRMRAVVAGVPSPQRAITLTKPKDYYYVTQRDDTLRALALRFYQNQNWRRILEANRTVVKDPNSISAGTLLVIPVN